MAVIAAGAAVVAATAQISAAIFTGVMAKRTHGLATQTKAMATETKLVAQSTAREAQATEGLAKATEGLVDQAQLDRELSWSPLLVRTVSSHVPSSVGQPLGLNETITLLNLGRGPALRCYYFAHEPDDNRLWCFAQHEGLSGGERVNLVATAQFGGAVPLDLVELAAAAANQAKKPVAALLCEDLVGNRVRFLVGRSGLEKWRLGQPNPPQWAVAHLLWD